MDCLFCKIINKEIPAEVIAESGMSLAFLDINPISDGHVLVIPKKHFKNFSTTDDEYLKDLVLLAKKVSNLVNDSKLSNWGINYLSNEEPIAGQVIMHFHLHLIPKYGKNEGLKFSVENKIVDKIEKIKKILIK